MPKRHYTKAGYPGGVVQTATQAHRDTFKRFHALFEAVVIGVHYVDQRDNVSAVATNDLGVMGLGSELVAANTDGSLSPLYSAQYGYRVECDIYTLTTTHRGGSYQVLSHVPVMQRGGLRDIDLWVPKACTNFVKDFPLDPHKLDGDVVLVQCVGGVWPKGAVILGMAPHRRNFTDAPRSVYGDRSRHKEVGDGQRKDGPVRLSRYNGSVVPHVDRHGNVLIDTSEAGHTHFIDPASGQVAVYQNNIPWTKSGNVAPTIGEDNTTSDPTGDAYPGGLGDGDRHPTEVAGPGGGDVTFKVKDTRRFRIEFTDNETVVRGIDKQNPREFKETGFVQVHKDDSGTRKIEIAASDDLVINVRSYGEGTGTITINCEQAVEGITLGGKSLSDRFATKEFVEALFIPHIHQTGIGSTSPPVVAGAFPLSIEEDTGKVLPQLNKVVTTKVQGE